MSRPAGQYKNRKYTFQASMCKFPPQARQLLSLVTNGQRYTEEQLMNLFYQAPDDVLYTTQDPWRVFCYYRSRLIHGGALKVENK
jgi:hypothetical protein